MTAATLAPRRTGRDNSRCWLKSACLMWQFYLLLSEPPALARRSLADKCPLEHTVQFLTRLATFAPDLRDCAAKILSRPRWR